jgi:hypothetical protein
MTAWDGCNRAAGSPSGSMTADFGDRFAAKPWGLLTAATLPILDQMLLANSNWQPSGSAEKLHRPC